MQWEMSLLIAFMFTIATYLILDCRLTKVIFGFGLLTNAGNLLILSTSKSPVGKTIPIIHGDPSMVDPLPQAFILTAIVIGFGLTAYLVVLSYRLLLRGGSEHTEKLLISETEGSE